MDVLGKEVAPMVREVDLNLLRALDAILEEQSVTKAAARLGLSQPAMSASLAKLRRHFGDELLTRVGNAYEATPLAKELLEPTRTALRATDRVFVRDGEFDPMTSVRDFSIVMSDYCTAALGPAIARRVRERSPRSKLYVFGLTPALVDAAPESMRTHDLVIMPHGFLSDLKHRDVYEDDWACIVSADNTKIDDRITIEDLAEMPWVLTFNQRTAFTTAMQQLRMQGLEPHTEVVTENFLTLGALIAGTDRVALVQERLGHLLARTSDVKVLPVPFDAAPLVETMWWHPMYEVDPAHRWLREIVIEAGIEIT
ncbi:LysR family transcriptional regulator [Nocardioides sp. AN3]